VPDAESVTVPKRLIALDVLETKEGMACQFFSKAEADAAEYITI
jgi:hypothetical protein